MRSEILKIGITGGMGSGKTIVSRIFHLLGIPLYNADERAKWILANNTVVKTGLIKLFGDNSFVDGILNRSFISQQAFSDPSKLEALNHLVHPQVGLDFEAWLKGKAKFPYILKEAALLFEAGSNEQLDKIITVFSPLELRIQRILERDPQRDEAGVRKIIQKQMDENEKLKRADYVIYNDEKSMLIPQVLKLHEELKTLG